LQFSKQHSLKLVFSHPIPALPSTAHNDKQRIVRSKRPHN
jgi:hypothetical protein